MKKSCFFNGNRDASETVEGSLCSCIIDLIENKGVENFIVGRYGKFDWIAAKMIIKIKKQYPHIRLTLLTPYHPGCKQISLPDGFDDILYLFEEQAHPKYAIIQANQKAICMCEYLVACVNHPGKAQTFLSNACSRENRGLIHTINIGCMKNA